MRWSLVVVVGAMLLCIPPSPATASSPTQQAAALADLMNRIATCSLPPCIGTEAEVFDSLVQGQVATDDLSFFTDFATAFPGSAHLLKGVVMWDIDSTVDGMLFILTGFHAAPAVVIAELEGTLLECEENDYPEEGQQEWYCQRRTKNGDSIEVVLYIGNGMLLVEM